MVLEVVYLEFYKCFRYVGLFGLKTYLKNTGTLEINC